MQSRFHGTVFSVLGALAVVSGCGQPVGGGGGAGPKPVVPNKDASPSQPGRDAGGPVSPDAYVPPTSNPTPDARGTDPGTPDAGEPIDPTPPDAGGGGTDATAPADSSPPGDAGNGTNTVGMRYSLRQTVATEWVGTRRSIKMEDGMMVFTGVFQANQFGGPQGHNERLQIRPGREYIFEYKIRFDTGYDFSRGGKIPGLAGASAPTGCVTTNGSGFSARSMWRQGGALIGYLYDNNQSQACGTGITTNFRFTIGRWHDFKQRVRLNTGNGNNGILQIWVDGAMVIDRSNISYMNTGGSNRIDQVLFHSFFGGSTQDWAPSRNCSISFAEPWVTLVEE